jgi:multiple sugar transport system ATP-binding protein
MLDPANGIDFITDIAFSQGHVAAVGDGLAARARDVREVSGRIVVPDRSPYHVYWGALRSASMPSPWRGGAESATSSTPIAPGRATMVADNMAFSMKLRNAPKSGIDRRVNNAANILGLTKLPESYPRQLSRRPAPVRGPRHRRDPHVFLFDEPLSNLDAKLRVQMRTEIKELLRRLQTTTVYVTRDQIEAMTMADKIVVMHDGIVEQMGAPLPAEQPVRGGFSGSPSMNLLKGTIRADSFEAQNPKGDASVTWPIGEHPADSEAKAAVYGIRPQHFKFDLAGLKAEVVVIEPTGSETKVVVRCGRHELTCLFRERITAKPDETIGTTPDTNVTHLFDATTGRES